MKKLILFLCIIALAMPNSYAQQPKKPNAAEIHESIKKLSFLGSVLYLAAHPDDENTKLISYMANNVKARTAYLSLTRGDGGQNLIGPEIRELLGVIRTEELLAARRTDGGEQFFTRANDFGYSKHPDETLTIWDKDEVLSDVVLAIRNFQPDVIINRFDHRTPGTTHGHHTSSAMLSVEAFNLTNDASKYPDQLKNTSTWQPKRMFLNTSWRFYGSEENFEAADKSKLMEIDTGVFFPSSGLSNTEISALSRSQHKSQGFGNTGTRGSSLEYVELIKGDMPKDPTNIFDGIDTSWNRVKGGKAIGNILAQIEAEYDFKNPSASIPKLVKAYTLIQKLEDTHWKTLKTEDIKNVIAACAGLYMEAAATHNWGTANEAIQLQIEVINRSNALITLESITNPNHVTISKNINLNNNIKFNFKETYTINTDTKITTPYWLTEPNSLGMYTVKEKSLIGKPETPRSQNITFNLVMQNISIPFTKPIIYKSNDPVKGELYKPFEIVPVVASQLVEPVLIFENDTPKQVAVKVTAGQDQIEGTVSLNTPKGWTISPKTLPVSVAHRGETKTVYFTVTPPKNQSEVQITSTVTVNGTAYNKALIEIDYDHIPFQTIVLPKVSKFVRLDIIKKGENIGYIQGAGDVVPESLRQIGYHVAVINPDDITATNLKRFDAIVIGIRAYNTVEDLAYKQNTLFDYVKQGGNLIVQYNTNRGLKVDTLAPYTLELSRDRVTDEHAEVTFLNPKHELLNTPNTITPEDFKGWTQERGLYFPNKWGKEFTPILGMHDKNETEKSGSLLVAKYGKGYYMYTGLSFFREFPAGVSGAYRLFANMLSIGKENISTQPELHD
ncbi:PIG-L family deacetylase [Formosa algae]|uniref:LmbE family N-acetylglucosaminyl deacetylase n=1 Tax=Formosa algae TaxID=225843 RepID=A0A9X1CC69_9FLAO|nr:PIG-L family deacetylase [Formosa algae]MBP1839945.1 LmbE family N-acetylglucosaminyl deacetylase [Formosa algae]MDQ0335544.1 LmbE family N-acetylglucosaminyl deacetylase [Formosa algae]OEI81756.1 LmbE family protein [Formosa algae]